MLPTLWQPGVWSDTRKIEEGWSAVDSGSKETNNNYNKCNSINSNDNDKQKTVTASSQDSKEVPVSSGSDPHIKVMGTLTAVQDAKEKILDVLDTKCNRVTLKMDVSHTEHSHVIGKGGNNIKKVMQDTGCHIHFPDSNRNSQMEKSNQVSIAGQATGAEKARAQIRELLPLVFMFDLPMHNTSQPVLPDSSSPHVQHIQQLYNVTVTFKQRPRLYVTQVLVRGTVSNASAVKEGCASVIKLYAGSMASSIPVSVTIEVAPQHHVFIMGRAGASVQAIMQRTGATVHFPDQSNVAPQRKSTVYITGPIDNVYLARQLLIGCLPLVLMFDIKDTQEIEPTRLAAMMEQLDVFISVKPKPRQSSKSVIVKSAERNGASMFEARRLLLGLERDPDMPAVTRDAFMPPLLSPDQLTSCNPLYVVPSPVHQETNLATASLWQLLPHLRNPAHPSVLPSTPAAAAQLFLIPGLPTNHAHPHPQQHHQAPGAAPDFTGELQLAHSFTKVDHNQNNTSTPLKMPPPVHRQNGVEFSVPDLSSESGISSSYEDRSSDQSSSPTDELSYDHHRSSTTNSSSNTSGVSSGSDSMVHNGGDVLSGRMVEMKISLSPSDSGSSCDLAVLSSAASQNNSPVRGAGRTGGRVIQPPPGLVHPAAASTASRQSLLLEENIKNAHVPFCNSDSGSKIKQGLQAELCMDKRAPGSDRPSLIQHQHQHQHQHQREQQQSTPGQHQLFTDDHNSFSSPFDYEEKKLLATKAMQKKPEGESRFPTDFWSGLGFSKSMPDSAIREKLKATNTRYRDSQQTITEAVENYDSESESGSTTAYPPMAHDYIQRRKQGFYSGLSTRADWSPSSSGSSSSCLSHSRTTTLPDLFSDLGLDKYTDKFLEQEIDLPTFLTLSDQDLKELGITKFGARRKMLLAIAELNKQSCGQSAVDHVPGKAPPTPPHHTSTNTNHAYTFSDQSSLFSRPHYDFISQSGRW